MNNQTCRVGFGYDVHCFAPQRKLILGGVRIPFSMGLLGHSDADVLLHAICDALLGAVALGDLGRHFPDTSRRYKNISSIKLVRRVGSMIREKGYEIANVDSTLILEQPKIANYVPKMRKNIAQALKIKIQQVSIKATTNESLGSLGSGEGCAAYAVVSIRIL